MVEEERGGGEGKREGESELDRQRVGSVESWIGGELDQRRQ